MAQQIIKNRAICPDPWLLLRDGDSVPSQGQLIVPVSLWQSQQQALLGRNSPLGIWLDSDQPPELIAADLASLALIAIHFPLFTDGRGYSYARLLRDRYRYQGELRAFGDIGHDQLYFLTRCGFDSMALPEDANLTEALAAFDDFTTPYQGASDDPQPLFRRHQRSG